MNIVIVESPAKAKTINQYLGNDYKVLASYGHIRDLPNKKGSVVPEEEFLIRSHKAKQRPLKHVRCFQENLRRASATCEFSLTKNH